MSITHDCNDSRSRMAPTSARLSMVAVMSLRAAATRQAECLLANARYRWTMRRITRFSTRRLQDIGFERDWDGSIIQGDGGRRVAACSGC